MHTPSEEAGLQGWFIRVGHEGKSTYQEGQEDTQVCGYVHKGDEMSLHNDHTHKENKINAEIFHCVI